MGKVLKAVATVASVVAAVATIATGIGSLAGGTMFLSVLGGNIAASTIAAVAGGVAAIAGSLAGTGAGGNIPQSATQLGRLQARLDTQAPRKIVLSYTALPVDLRYYEGSGEDDEYIDYIAICAAHKVGSIDKIWFEDKLAWTATGGVQGEYVGYLSNVTVRLEGTSANTIAINGGTRWGANCRLTGCAYLRLRIKRTGNSDEEQSPLASGLPGRVTIVGAGMPMYDPRYDSTAGGVGAQRIDDQSTWGPSSGNPIIQALNVLIGWRINGKLSVGAGLPPKFINLDSAITAANICDETVALAGGGSQPRYRTAGAFSTDDAPMAIVASILAGCAGELLDSEGELSFLIKTNTLSTPAVQFDDNDLLSPGTWDAMGGQTNLQNIISGTFTDPSPKSLYQPVPYPSVKLSSEDGIERTRPIDFGIVENSPQAERLAKQTLQRMQYPGTFTAEYNMKAMAAKVGSIVWQTYSPRGWVNKPFRVVRQKPSRSGRIALVLREENAAIYAWDSEDGAAVQPAESVGFDPRNSGPVLLARRASETANWSRVKDDDGGKPEDNATVGAPDGTPVGDRPAEQVTHQLDTFTVSIADLETEAAQARTDIDDLFTTYGSTAAAADSADIAQAAAQIAENARDASSGFAGQAETFKTQAGQFAADAANEKTEAVAAKEGAEAAEAGASTQATLSATARLETERAQRQIYNGKAADDYWVAGYVQSKAQLPDTTARAVVGGAVEPVTVTGVGEVAQSATYQIASERVARPIVDGQKMRLRMKTRILTDPASTHAHYLWLGLFKADGSYGGYVLLQTFSGLKVADGWQFREYIVDPSALKAAGGSVNSGTWAEAAEWRFMLSYNHNDNTKWATQQIDVIDITDVTGKVASEAAAAASAASASFAESKADEAGTSAASAGASASNAASSENAAGSSATASADSASLSSTKADEAEASAVASETSKIEAQSYTTASRLSLAQTFPQAISGDIISATSGSGTPASLPTITNAHPTWVTDSGSTLTPPLTTYTLALIATVPLIDGVVYEAASDVTQLAGSSSSFVWYFQVLDANHNLITNTYTTSNLQTLNANGERKKSIQRFGKNVASPAHNITTSGGAFVRCTLLINRAAGGVATNPASQVKVNSMFVEDVTSRQASETSAVASQSSAAVASSSAAASQQSAILSANVGQGALNQNSGFDDYPSATVGALPGGYHTRSGNALPYRVPDPQGGYALRYPSIAGEQGYIRSENWKINPNVVTDGYYVLSAEAIAHAGTFSGSAFMVRAYNSAVSASQDLALFPNEYQPAPVIGRAYSFNKLVKVTLPDAFGFEQFTFAHWAVAAAGSIAAANDIEWRKALIRPATPEEVAANEVLPPLQAEVAVNSGAIASIEDTAAFLEEIVAAAGGNPGVFRILAGKFGSNITLAGDRVLVMNYITGELVEVARFEGGVARLNQALIRTLLVSPTDASEIFHKVQLQPIITLASHGDVVQYQGGASYGQNPSRIDIDIAGASLPALTAGEAYDVRATSITGSQFTMRAVKVTASTAVTQTSAAGSSGTGTPKWATNKPTAANARDDNYLFTITATLTKQGETEVVQLNEADPSTWRYTTTYSGTVTLYGKVGAAWVGLGTQAMTGIYKTTGTSSGHTNTRSFTRGLIVNSSSDFGSGADRFGVHDGAGAVITAFPSVSYSTQTTSSEAPVSGQFKVSIYPPE